MCCTYFLSGNRSCSHHILFSVVSLFLLWGHIQNKVVKFVFRCSVISRFQTWCSVRALCIHNIQLMLKSFLNQNSFLGRELVSVYGTHWAWHQYSQWYVGQPEPIRRGIQLICHYLVDRKLRARNTGFKAMIPLKQDVDMYILVLSSLRMWCQTAIVVLCRNVQGTILIAYWLED